jgi:Fe-S-cluster containining protein
MNSRKRHLEDLRRELRETRALSLEQLADQIRAFGFQCLRCGECCSGEENSVVVFPFEIRAILERTGLPWLEAARPPGDGEWDDRGRFHTLEWRLQKKGGSCKFYGNGECMIYEERPLLCKSYPFFLEKGVLGFSECAGLGVRADRDRSQELAALLKERRIAELEEAIALIKKFQDFPRGAAGRKTICIVHDSEGAHQVLADPGRADPGASSRGSEG